MGYMGFGMKREVYTRKPKQPFKKLRKIYENELYSKKYKSQGNGKSFSKAEVERIKSKIRKDFKKANIRHSILVAICAFITLILFWYLFV